MLSRSVVESGRGLRLGSRPCIINTHGPFVRYCSLRTVQYLPGTRGAETKSRNQANPAILNKLPQKTSDTHFAFHCMYGCSYGYTGIDRHTHLFAQPTVFWSSPHALPDPYIQTPSATLNYPNTTRPDGYPRTSIHTSITLDPAPLLRPRLPRKDQPRPWLEWA